MALKENGNKLIGFYKKMLFFRRFEERVLRAYTKRMFSGFCHVHIGQEAVCVGVQESLEHSDYVLSGYRSHTQALAKGVSSEAVFGELLGKASGCAKGKGGSMHMFSEEHRFLGGNGIVGAQAPLAVGVGFSLRYKEENSVVVCYLGDAAMNQGAVFEAMNMAACWSLPVLFVIENNQYGMGTDIKRVTSVDKLSKRALAFDMKHAEVDGMNVMSVYEHCSSIVSLMKKSPEPYLLEAHTYRYKGHSVSDPGLYRTKEELASYQAKDPLLQMEKLLLDSGALGQEDLNDLNQKIKEEIKQAEQRAVEESFPHVKEACTEVFCA